MSEQPPSWGDINNRQPAEPVSDRYTEVCALVFSSGPGKELLALLRARYFDNVGSPLADERALRVRATQQHLIRELELACERGLAAKKRTTPAT